MAERLSHLQLPNEYYHEDVRSIDNIIDEFMGWMKEVLAKLSEEQLIRCPMKVCCISSKHKDGADEIQHWSVFTKHLAATLLGKRETSDD